MKDHIGQFNNNSYKSPLNGSSNNLSRTTLVSSIANSEISESGKLSVNDENFNIY